jgi:hypothetical protein
LEVLGIFSLKASHLLLILSFSAAAQAIVLDDDRDSRLEASVELALKVFDLKPEVVDDVFVLAAAPPSSC